MSPVYMCPSIEEDSYIVTALITGSPIPLLFGGTECCEREMVSKPNHLIYCKSRTCCTEDRANLSC